MSKFIDINGETFEVIRPRKYNVKKAIEKLAQNERKTIYDHYETPSIYKVEIWQDWLEWALKSPVSCFTCSSANTFCFTIEGILYNEATGEDIGLICITKSHNKLYLVN